MCISRYIQLFTNPSRRLGWRETRRKLYSRLLKIISDHFDQFSCFLFCLLYIYKLCNFNQYTAFSHTDDRDRRNWQVVPSPRTFVTYKSYSFFRLSTFCEILKFVCVFKEISALFLSIFPRCFEIPCKSCKFFFALMRVLINCAMYLQIFLRGRCVFCIFCLFL